MGEWGEELELDVVGVAEDEDRAVELVGDGRLRERTVGCLSTDYAVGLEMLLPVLEVRPVRYGEAHVVETGAGLVERLAESTRVNVVASFDRSLDRVSTIERIEP